LTYSCSASRFLYRDQNFSPLLAATTKRFPGKIGAKNVFAENKVLYD
jgi:hypothetical protein